MLYFPSGHIKTSEEIRSSFMLSSKAELVEPDSGVLFVQLSNKANDILALELRAGDESLRGRQSCKTCNKLGTRSPAIKLLWSVALCSSHVYQILLGARKL